jgi:hypothetical protein
MVKENGGDFELCLTVQWDSTRFPTVQSDSTRILTVQSDFTRFSLQSSQILIGLPTVPFDSTRFLTVQSNSTGFPQQCCPTHSGFRISKVSHRAEDRFCRVETLKNLIIYINKKIATCQLETAQWGCLAEKVEV